MPWWHYEVSSIPGDGRVLVNTGNGNLVFQDDDMTVPHKGVALAFRRTYNSQSMHDVSNSDGSVPSMYGNGWTSTFDAHLSGSRTGTISVWDVDGARYDYTVAADGVTMVPPPGQHATLVTDGYTGYFWTKKSGTTYYFWAPDGATTWAGWIYQQYGAYAGRLHQIIGRNRNTYLTFLYSWDNANSAAGGKISAIAAQSESGLTANLSFADVGGNRLLSQLTYPDGATSVSYGYDQFGNLINVSRPPNNAAGTRLSHSYGYQTLGTYTVIAWADSPRWESCASGCGSDGAWLQFWFTGTNASLTLNAIAHGGVVNLTIPDGSSSPTIQSGYPTTAVWYLSEYYTIGTSTTTFRDSDGHATNWVMDSHGRPIQTQECKAVANQTCSAGAYLTTNASWDANNNVVSTIDPRGNKTDYAYDANANVVAVGEPMTTTSDGTFKPTILASYDSSNNLVAACDEVWTTKHGLNWNGTPGTSDSLCPQSVGSPSAPGTSVFHYNPTTNESYGELAWSATPLGYHVNYAYPTGAADDGLATNITGDSFIQADGTSFQETRAFSYDANGNVLTSTISGLGTWSYAYDSLGRRLTSTDPDQVTSYVAYWPNGAVSRSETAFQHVNGTGAAFQYDLDGNLIQETRHYGNVAGNTNRWYDGADRLVEVMYPRHPDSLASLGSDYSLARPDRVGGTFTWGTRYLYDLSYGQTPPRSVAPAYGGLYRVQETTANNGWQDVRGMTYDALDRELQMWDFGEDYGQTGAAQSEVYVYDTEGQLGFLSRVGKAASTEMNYRQYDERGLLIADTYLDPGGAQYTPGTRYAYDADGRVHSVQSLSPGASYGSMSYSYDEDSRVLNKSESTDATFDDAASTISYGYYPDGRRQSLSVTRNAGQGGFDQQNMFQYAYRGDGALTWKNINLPSAASFVAAPGTFRWTYTAAGRLLQRFDPFTGSAISGKYASAAMRSALAKPVASTFGIRRVAAQTPAVAIAARMIGAQRANVRPPPTRPGMPAVKSLPPVPAGVTSARKSAALVVCPPANSPVTANPVQPALTGCCGADCCSVDCTPPTPTPTGPPPTPRPAATFAPITVSYDSYGRVASYMIPSGGTYSGFAYDAEGSTTDFWGYGDTSVPAKHFNNAYNIRGELTGQHAFDGAATTAFNTSWPSFSVRPYNGTMLPIRDGDNPAIAPPSVYGPKLNGKMFGVDYHINYISNFPSPNTICQAIMARFTWTQDASGRDIQAGVSRIATFPDPCVNTQPGYFNGNVSKAYDFNDHLMQWDIPANNYWPTFGSSAPCTNTAPYGGLLGVTQYGHNQYDYGWGAEGKLVQIVAPGSFTRNLHWDGDELLYVTDGLGNVESVKVSSDAETNPQNKFVVRDRDWTGAQVMTHDATGYSAWLPPNPTHAACTPNSHPQASPSYDNPYEPIVTHPTLDSYMDFINVFQGRRTYDSTSMQWSTPDSNPGGIDDPVSMKRYTWNRNDPLRYGDFNGEDSIEVAPLGRVTARAISSPLISPEEEILNSWPGMTQYGVLYFTPPPPQLQYAVVGSPSRLLGYALVRAGFQKSAGEAAHHIVPYAMRRFASNFEARAILKKFGVDLNEAANGVWLKSARHWGIHSRAYMDAVVAQLRSATSGDHVREILRAIAEDIQSESFPR